MKNKKIILITGVSSGIGNAFVRQALTNSKMVIVGMGREEPENIKDKNFQPLRF